MWKENWVKMIEQFADVLFEPDEVFGSESERIIFELPDAADYERAFQKRDRPAIWYYHALAWVVATRVEKMDDYDVRSCARLIADTIAGPAGTAKIRARKKEKQVSKRAFSMYNRLARERSSPLAMARILATYILDQYQATIETRERLSPLKERFRLLKQ